MGVQEHARLNEIVVGAILARAVCRMAELGVADLIPRGEARPVAELAAKTGCHERTLYRTLRFLASHGVFEERDPAERSFALTPVAEALRQDAEGSFHAAGRMFDRIFVGLDEFDHCLRTGESGLVKVMGMPMFEYMPAHPEVARIFDAAMTAIHGPETAAMLEAYDFSGIGTLCDVGGGNGSLLIPTLKKYPHLKGMLFDLEHVASRGIENVRAAGLEDRCTAVPGSFFESVPRGADAYLLRHVIHDWSDEKSVAILKNCRAAVPEGGRLLIVETVIPPGNGPSVAKDMDMNMLVYPGGMERTEAEYRELFDASGFRLERITPTPSPVSVVEGRPV